MDNSDSSNKIPLGKALKAILLSVIFISGSATLVFLYLQNVREKQKFDPAYNIVALVQTRTENEALKNVYLAELLNLSIDRPTNLYSFNSKEAQAKLLSSPVIKHATVKKMRPGTILVDYVMRRPIAFIGDYSNTAIDADGVIFPFKPFYTPKKLPTIYLGETGAVDENGELVSNFVWGEKLQHQAKELSFEVLDYFTNCCSDSLSSLVRIDVSKAFAQSYGQRQIVLSVEDYKTQVMDGNPVIVTTINILRLSPINYKEQLANYLVLRSHLQGEVNAETKRTKAITIDLRLSELAFITKYK